eukprot:TRINITY_DN6675_c1_g1_i5.p3 TRINITY_DN6675_c1_g1~~TRINITY_DN6675_c1_g1_i5.p3  ORF type:complete len:103 (+),score=0.42 TRINITY_DN6675_c1_g1_i5:734-1042(+)
MSTYQIHTCIKQIVSLQGLGFFVQCKYLIVLCILCRLVEIVENSVDFLRVYCNYRLCFKWYFVYESCVEKLQKFCGLIISYKQLFEVDEYCSGLPNTCVFGE